MINPWRIFRRQKGSIAVMAAGTMVVALGVGALAIDVGNLYVVRNQLQNAADAAALSGAACIWQRGTCRNTAFGGPTWDTANTEAINWITQNKAESTVSGGMGPQAALSSATVQCGIWDVANPARGLQNARSCSGNGWGVFGNPNLTTTQFAAVEVTVTKSSTSGNGAVAGILSSVFGVNTSTVSAHAISTITGPGYVGGGRVFPFAIPLCLYNTYWNSSSQLPVIDPSTGAPYIINSNAGSPTCHFGDFTSFFQNFNDQGDFQNLFNTLNPQSIAIGQQLWLQPGAVPWVWYFVEGCGWFHHGGCSYGVLPVVNSDQPNPAPNQNKPFSSTVMAFACVKFDHGYGFGFGGWRGANYISFQLDATSDDCLPGGFGGSGGYGPYYGTPLPARLVG